MFGVFNFFLCNFIFYSNGVLRGSKVNFVQYCVNTNLCLFKLNSETKLKISAVS